MTVKNTLLAERQRDKQSKHSLAAAVILTEYCDVLHQLTSLSADMRMALRM
jgi:RNase H-fold protein (predicted Holliday junction resolvase)